MSCRSTLHLRAAWLLGALLALGPGASLAATEVELLTMGPGEDLYARFGHTALRVISEDGDTVYNYGFTDFETPGLVWRFLRGTVVFWVVAQSYPATVAAYAQNDRSLFRQRLALSPAQHEELARLLRLNAEPRNRRYLYHHFRDNCSTRPRDLLDRVTEGKMLGDLERRPAGVTLRTMVHQGFSGRLPVLLLSDLILGRDVDRPLTVWEACFLPRVLMEVLPAIRRADGGALARLPDPVYLRRQPSPLRGDPRAGERLLWAGAGLLAALGSGLLWLAHRRRRWAGLLLLALALPLGLAGLLIWALAVITPLPELRWNENLLLLWPTDLALIAVGGRWLRGRLWAGRVLRAYAGLRAGVVVAALLGQAAGWLVQRPLAFAVAALALAAALILACRALPRAPARPPSPPVPLAAPEV